jgi:hypothetical protein
LDAWSLIFFFFNHIFSFKVFGIFALVCDKNQQLTRSGGTLGARIETKTNKQSTTMRQILTLLLILSTNFQLFCQTEKLEIENLSLRYQQKEFPIDDYKQYGQDWRNLLSDLGGYPNLPYNYDNKAIKFEYLIETGVPKKITFDRILEWSAINFGSLDAVLNYKDFETGKIILKGNFNVTHRQDLKNFWGNLKEEIKETTCYQTYIFTIKDNKLKIEIMNIKYKFSFVGYMSSNIYIPGRTFEMSIHNIYPITNFDSSQWKEKLDLLNQTNLKIINLKDDISSYIKINKDDYNF